MYLSDFRRAGHWPTLLCAFLYFDVSFMIWVLMGALAAGIGDQLWPLPPGADVAEHLRAIAPAKGLLVAVPILGGAVLRLVLGVMTDRWGARRTAILGMVLTALPLVLGWLWADSYGKLLVVGALLGVAGASFAAALPLASRWYPPQYQGLALGIAGAGNSGTALATFFGPLLATTSLAGLLGWWVGGPGLLESLAGAGWAVAAPLGWQSVFGLALVPLGLTLVLFVMVAREAPSQPPPRPLRDYVAVLGQADTWHFCTVYALTFGGFVGLASFLSTFFKDQFYPVGPDMGVRWAGYFTTLCVIAGSFLRPVGGYLADRIGGVRLLLGLLGGLAVVLLGLGLVPPLPVAVALLFAAMGLLGMGNGAVFQLVPQRFPREIGVVTGIVGAAGGVGGFFLPSLLGGLKGLTGSYGSGFVVLALVALGCLGLLLAVRARWQCTFLAAVEPKAEEAPTRWVGG